MAFRVPHGFSSLPFYTVYSSPVYSSHFPLIHSFPTLLIFLLFCKHTKCVYLLSWFTHVQLHVTLWTVACQALPSIGFSRQESWSVLPCSPPRDLPEPETEPASLTFSTLAGRFFTTRAAWENLANKCVTTVNLRD